ncbi:protease HtpX [Solemya velum gill symbiont]|uniref:Protease HtpX n=1 Tax=Solemya velum gill symbiont TaxID=2340 RepID=A0A1T2HER5_SOVGS|nr:protease HtpX [Solemya velum gill symbiont]OOY35400.1 zinc metalloprotease HtpX [Solemya velum gill symbiont]OOY38010.1 zinc metalloprotease HtpX [Solemya velum gill symbiont]OOY38962.1 zinc metalloprotease HtpX [Solemya velum gill symbiont]OOY44428.1 zinc metalloprotease HtpX [Solemya velum gill symbiont]OOY48114.1 zinc metalloprotease HtpX [Solemya velum gill symbiont]
MQRIFLFLATNFAVLLLVGIIFQLLGIEGILQENGVDMNLQALLVLSVVIGFGGSFFSLFMSKWLAKRSMGVQIIETPSGQAEQWLVDTVTRQAQQAGIGMPEVGIFNSPAPNAFATGANRNNSLVAVSTGLLENMNRDEVEAVLAHEVTHVANGDMVTLTLIQGIVNSFVIFFSRVVGHLVDRVVFKTERGYGPGYYIGSIVAQIIFSLLASMIVMWFSRRREFRADAGGAALAGRHKMIAALRRLQTAHDPEPLPDEMAAFGISGKVKSLFSSHPPLDERIIALENSTQ